MVIIAAPQHILFVRISLFAKKFLTPNLRDLDGLAYRNEPRVSCSAHVVGSPAITWRGSTMHPRWRKRLGQTAMLKLSYAKVGALSK
jgi:hypothetical protein